MAKVSLLTAGIAMIALLASTNPEIMSARDVSAISESGRNPGSDIERVTLNVDGMTCRSCVPGIRKALLSIPGVKNAQVSYAAAQAVVEHEKGKVTHAQLIKAIENESNFFLTFTAKVTSRD